MNKFKDLLSEIRMTVSADYKVSPSGRKVHKMKKIADVVGDRDGDGDVDANDKKLAREEFEQIDEVTYYDGSDMLGEADRSSSYYQFTHKPGDSESEKKLSDLKKSVKGTGKRVVLMGRLGKDNPNSAKYRKGGEVTKQRGPFMGTHQYIRKGDAGHHDVYVYNRRESYEGLEEAVDKQEQRFLMLARLGLVQKSEVSKLRIALDLLKADKPLSIAQRSMLLSVMGDLISLVTGDDTVFNRVKMDVQKESVEDLDENAEALKKKASASGVSLSTLKTVYKRGVAAWNSGHRPGTNPQQWGLARVNSYITKGKGTYHGADKDLREQEELQEQHYVLAHSRVRGSSSPVKDINGKIKTHDTEDDAKKHAEELNKRTSSSNIYYTYGGKGMHEETDAVQSLENSLNDPDGYDAIDQMMQSISKDCGISPKELHNKFVQKHGKTPDEYAQGVKEACWDSHKQVGMKKKGDKMVPNCVPKGVAEAVAKDPESGLNKNYVTGLSASTAKARAAHFKKTDKMSDSDPAAYEPAPGDATAKTKLSAHTKKYRDMYGEGYVSLAQQRAVWANRKDGGKGHPDNKKKNRKEEVEIEEGRMKDIVTNAQETDRLKKKEVVPFDGPYTKVSSSTTDKSGAKHTPMSAAKHLARLALKKQLDKNKE